MAFETVVQPDDILYDVFGFQPVSLPIKIHGMALAKVPPKFLGSHVCLMIRQPRPAKDRLGKIECNLYNRMLANLPRIMANDQI